MLFENNPIGICFIHLRSEEKGFVDEFGISTKWQGKGWGKKLFEYSLQNAFKFYPKWKQIELDVTENNPAFHIYRHLGFKFQSKYVIWVWKKNEKMIGG